MEIERGSGANKDLEQDAGDLDRRDHGLTKTPAWKRFLAHVGPGLLVSVAYMDPNNLETDLQAGGTYRYELLWVVLIGIIFSVIIQSLAANLGVVTGRTLAEICRSEYPKRVRICLWLMAEVAVISADLTEVIGTAFAFNLLFHIPMWVGVLLTGGTSIVIIGLQKYGHKLSKSGRRITSQNQLRSDSLRESAPWSAAKRTLKFIWKDGVAIRKLEFLISMMILVVMSCFCAQLIMVKPPAVKILEGLFIPRLNGSGAIGLAIAIIGANVVPHNLYMHSALVISRKTSPTETLIKETRLFFILETGFALLVALVLNIVVVSITGTVCFSGSLSDEDAQNCGNLTLGSSSFLLSRVIGRSSGIVFGVALLASGLSATVTSTYAAQFIMQGFLNIRMKKWKRNLMTRSIAIVPSLIVAIIGGSSGSGRLIIMASMIIFFVLPFSVIPLLKFSSSSSMNGRHKSSIYVMGIAWALGLLSIGISVYFLSTSFFGWLIHNSLPKYANVLVSIPVLAVMLVYLVAVVYLMFKKDTTAVIVADSSRFGAENVREATATADVGDDDEPVPFREDLADIPFPE